MASRKKEKKADGKTYFVLPDGNRFEVTGENGKYVFCGGTQFRKSRGEIVTETVAVQEAPCEKAQDE